MMKWMTCAIALLALIAPLVAANEAVPLHGSGTTNPSKYFWKVMDAMEAGSKVRTRPAHCAPPRGCPRSPLIVHSWEGRRCRST
jgi:hypothetical protein